MNKYLFHNLLVLIVINILIFQTVIQNYISIFQYFDEVLTVILFIYYLYIVISKGISKLPKKEIWFWGLCLGIVAIGLIGNFVFKYQTDIKIILIDMFSFFKYIFIFFGAYTYFKKNKSININSIINLQFKLIVFITIITFMFMLVNLFFGIESMTYEMRYGIRAFEFIYFHAGSLNTVCTYFSIFLLMKIFNEKDNKQFPSLILLLNIIIQISTLRSRAIIMAILTIFLFILFNKLKKNRKIKYKNIVFICIIFGIVLASSQINTYFFPENRTPRSDLLKGSITLMTEHFPIGTGFATYGSNAARDNYSVLYYRFGFNKYYGMNPVDGQFLTDCFWPIVFAQFGFIGLILYLSILYLLIKMIWKNCDNQMKKCVIMLISINFIFSSAVSSAFVNPSAVAYMFFLSLCLLSKTNKKAGDEKIELQN